MRISKPDMNDKRIEEYNLLKDDYEHKKKNTVTASDSLKRNPDSIWLMENLNTCLAAEQLAKQLLESCMAD